MNYDAIIIGFGKAGKTLAGYLGNKKLKVALIEQDDHMYGGTCINVGCIPSKSLVTSSVKSHEFSKSFPQKETSFKDAIAEKIRVTDFLRGKNYDKLNSNENVEIINGVASFISNYEISVKTASETLILKADKIFINTGSKSVIPDIKGAFGTKVYTSTEIMNLKELPSRLTIVGGGYIGLEFASMFANFGSSVTILDLGSKFIPREDEDIAAEVRGNFIKNGIDIILGVRIDEIKDDGTVVYKAGEDTFELQSDAVLLATGRKPNIEELNLGKTDIKLTERGAIKTNESLETSVPHVYALGDVNGGLQFTYVSLDDFRIIKDHLEHVENPRTITNRGNVPYSVFISPSLSRVGLGEDEAKRQGYDSKTFKLKAAGIPKAQVLKSTDGLLKITINNKDNTILGASLYCEESYEIINIIKIAMDLKLDYRILRDNIYTHPTMSEALNDLLNQ